ncbi:MULTISPECIES: alpha/beta hydrolase [unclassified Microbacterium]|uniref:alpha/beta hydrolase n=1 Tax=Microbacterium TaxID=33882 RepID=UPI003BA2D430
MPIDPLLLPVLAGFEHAPAQIDDFVAFRASMNAANDHAAAEFALPGPDVAEHRTVHVPVGGETVRMDLYRPHTSGPHPVHLFLHGGGWVMNTGYSRDADALARRRSIAADCIVLSVDYRKAPEHPFPAAIHDSIAVVDWVREHADELGVLRGGLTIGGQSSGANIAAGTAIALREAGRDDVRFQLLEVPALDLSHSISRPDGEEWPLSAADARLFSGLYLSGADPRTATASPLLAEDLTGLPPALIAIAEYDVLRPDGEEYARRLREAGVPTEVYLGAGHVHMSPSMTALLPAAGAWQDTVNRALADAHADYRASLGRKAVA